MWFNDRHAVDACVLPLKKQQLNTSLFDRSCIFWENFDERGLHVVADNELLACLGTELILYIYGQVLKRVQLVAYYPALVRSERWLQSAVDCSICCSLSD